MGIIKMIRKDIFALTGNEVLARPLLTSDYQVILPEGALLRKEYIPRIMELGILEVYIKEKEIANEMVILKSEIKDGITEKVKNVLEHHTYQHDNGGLATLAEAADYIISTILAEERVVEKIYDIRERSTDIYEHSINVCSLAILTALKLKLKKEKIHDIGVGCLLHDIGMRYTAGDYARMDISELNAKQQADYKKHPIYGYTCLQEEKWASTVSKSIVLYHHERMDGSGFPLHLRDIPLECRIVNVCDAFDEMICGISCKSMKVYEAVEYLKAFQNKQFDAKIVEAFLSFTAIYPVGSYVKTNKGELAVVIAQNRDFRDRPVIRIIKDRQGNDVNREMYMDLMKVRHIFIEAVVD
ncbi:MAG: HD domain-containing protein [Roseburia sp.]|nr:HD domain-containing protein [Roseburia sp.]